jgi:hypothetical protein
VTYVRSASLIVSAIPKVSTVTDYARWRRVGTTLWRMTGTTETEIAPGNYEVEFTWGFNCKPPANIPVTLNAGTVTSITGTYLLPIGGIAVTLSPPEAVAAGAQWRRAGTTAWFDSGTTETNLAVGKWTIEFKPIPGGWVTPTTQSLTISHGSIATANAAYTGWGSLRVILSPPEAVTAGAKWRRVGATVWHDSGTSESAVPAGPCAVEFKPLSAWAAPATRSFSLYPNQGVEMSGAYLPTGALTVTIMPVGLAAVTQWRRVGTTAWFASGAVETNIPTGDYALELKDAAGKVILIQVHVTISNAATTLATVVAPNRSAVTGADWGLY